MAYQNVPVDDGYQVVQQIANFAQSVGWTVHRNEDRPADTSFRLVTLSAGNGYVTLIGDQNNIYLNGHRGIDTGADWDEQPDQYAYQDGNTSSDSSQEKATRARVILRVNPISSVHFFGSMTPEPYVYAAIEQEPGFYRHLVIGHFQKFGTALGGLFWDVSGVREDRYGSYVEYHRAPFLYNANIISTQNLATNGGFDCQDLAGNPMWCRLGARRDSWDTATTTTVGGHWGQELHALQVASPVVFNSRTPLIPPLIWISTGGQYVPFGTPPGFRYINMDFYQAGDEFTLGTDTWKVFPWARQIDGARNPSVGVADGPEHEATRNYGIAYLKG